MNLHTELFLRIAREQNDLLEKREPGLQLGPTAADYSPAFQHALICSAFSAFAVEHAIAQLRWERCWLQTPEPFRQITRRQAAAARTIPAKLELLRSTTDLAEDLLRDIQKLFDYRNGIAHANPGPFEGDTLGFEALEAIETAGRADELDKAMESSFKGDDRLLKNIAHEFGEFGISLNLAGVGTDDIEKAPWNLDVAERAVQSLEEELRKPWPAPPPTMLS